MSLKVAVQMDPLEGLNMLNLASFWISLEARKRGHNLYHYVPSDLSLDRGRVTARARPLKLDKDKKPHYELGEWKLVDLGTFDVVLLRQDPPFNMEYLTTTYILERITDRVLVTNNPAEIRNAPEKLFPLQFPDLSPPTLISANREDIRAFKDEYGEIIIKPLYRNAGAQVFHIGKEGANLNALLDMFFEQSKEPLVVQKFLPEIMNGDKRLILLDGQLVGGITRFPVPGEIRSNLILGGRYEKVNITPRDREICDRIGPELKKRELIFAGIDVIGDYLTEVNVTSPTGIRPIKELYNIDIARDLWDIFEGKLKDLRKGSKR